MAYRAIVIVISMVIIGLMGAACPETASDPDLKSGKSGSPGIQKRIEKLEMQYGIILKDDPPAAETEDFRRDLAQAKLLLSEGKTKESDLLVEKAEVWMDSSRREYYKRSKDSILAGNSRETADSLMAKARSFQAKAESKRTLGDQWAFEQYNIAATEEGELALLAAERRPENAESVIEMFLELDGYYRTAGRIAEAEASKERVQSYLKESQATISEMIESCVSGRTRGCEESTLTGNREAYENKKQEILALNDVYNGIADAGSEFDPGALPYRSMDLIVEKWYRNLDYYWNVASQRGVNRHNDDKKDWYEKCRVAMKEHDAKWKRGSEPASGTGITLRETGAFVQGDAVVIRGTLQNNKTEPIGKPRVVVVGGLMSNDLYLGYEKFNPLTSTSFSLKVECFPAEAYNASGGKLPDHELLLIFTETNGLERRVVQPISR